MSRHLIWLLTVLSLMLSPTLAATEKSLPQQLSITSEHVDELFQQTKHLQGGQLTIIQLEWFTSNQKLRLLLDKALQNEQLDQQQLLPLVQQQVQFHTTSLQYLSKNLTRLQNSMNDLAKEERLLMQIELNDRRRFQAKLYQEQYQNYLWLKQLQQDVQQPMAELKTQVMAIAKFTSASLNYVLTKQADLEQQMNGLPEEQKSGLQLETIYLKRDIDTRTNMLATFIGIAEPMGIDTIDLKHQLFLATGDLTHDLFNWQMLKSTFSDSHASLKKWLISGSSRLSGESRFYL